MGSGKVLRASVMEMYEHGQPGLLLQGGWWVPDIPLSLCWNCWNPRQLWKKPLAVRCLFYHEIFTVHLGLAECWCLVDWTPPDDQCHLCRESGQHLIMKLEEQSSKIIPLHLSSSCWWSWTVNLPCFSPVFLFSSDDIWRLLENGIKTLCTIV